SFRGADPPARSERGPGLRLPEPHPAPDSGAHRERSGMSLKDKVAIVTGAASGIGKEIARQFVGEGAKVAIADLNLQAGQAAAAELDPTGERVMAVAMNVTDEAQVDAGVEAVVARFG